jgi:hypothetical protein
VFVASGGSLAAAQLGADLHQRHRHALATVMTPMELLASGVDVPLVVVLSDSVSHPDVRAALAAATGTVVLLCNREAAEVASVAAGARVVTCPRPGRDGYVATNSVLSLSLGLLTLYGLASTAPAYDELAAGWFDHRGVLPADHDPGLRDVLCLYPPGLRNVAVDLETRSSEAGLGRVAITDIRNLGHGRHVGLYRNAGTTSVLVLGDERWEDLCRTTVDALPPGVRRVAWTARQPWPWSAVELLLPSFGYLAVRATEAGVDPGNPAVFPATEALFRLRGQGLEQYVPGR